MSIDIAIVPVAGHGTRLLPATKSQPKEMLSVGRKPVVQYVVEELALSGIRRILFITSHGKASIEQHFDIDERLTTYLRETGREQQLQVLEFERQEMEYFYTRQRRQLGLGHAVLCARPLIGRRPVWWRWAIPLSACMRKATLWGGWWSSMKPHEPMWWWLSRRCREPRSCITASRDLVGRPARCLN